MSLPGGLFILKKMKKKEKILHRVVTFLDREELDFLDNLTKDIFFSRGIKIPRATLLKELIDLFLPFNSPESGGNQNYENLLSLIEKRIERSKDAEN